ncbi:phosphatidylethanolamine-binding protein [Mycena leptocephala]|nr:phosphatidylethanolamine-binding protein [Mycena leptocephala]
MICLTVVSLALLSFANAATTLVDIEAIEVPLCFTFLSPHCPRVAPHLHPGAVLSVAFSGSEITPGKSLTQTANVSTKPVVTASAFNASLTGTFTIAMVDADVRWSHRHWLANGVTLTSGTVSDTSATNITTYAGPGPATNSGPHRYVVLLYAQPSTFKAPADLSAPVDGVNKFDLNAYVKDSGLGDLVAANYFIVEVGTDPTSLPATSAVVTSTLASVTASGASGGASGATDSASAPASSDSTKPNGAVKSELQTAVALLAAGAILVLL